MLRFVRSQPMSFSAQGFIFQYNGRLYFPCIQHTTIAQDRAVGDLETFGEHSHNVYHVVVFARGQGTFSLDGKMQHAKPGTVVCVSPGQRHDFVTNRKNAIYSEITFSMETPHEDVLSLSFVQLLQTYVGLPLKLQDSQTVSRDTAIQLELIIREITDHARSGMDVTPYCLQRSLTRLLDCLIWTCCTFDKLSTPHDKRLVTVKQYIDQHYVEQILAEDLAAFVKMSKGYLFRAFKEAYGLPPMAYQRQLRLEAAKTLLRATALRCNEVAVRCGYENIPFFHRHFKAATGLTPGQFRKKCSDFGDAKSKS